MCPLFSCFQLFSNFTYQHMLTGNGAARPKGLSGFCFFKIFSSISYVFGFL